MRGALSPTAARPLPSAAPASVSAHAGRVPAALVCSQELASSRDPPGGGCRPSRISGSLWIETGGLLAACGGLPGAVSGAEFAPFPSCLPPTSSGDGPVCHWLALLWSFSILLFCERPAVCSGRLIFSLAIPQFKRAPSDCSQGPSGLVLTLSNAAHSSPFRPHLLVADVGIWGTFLLGVAFRLLICGPYLIFPPSQVALRDSKTSPRPASARVSW